MADPSLRQSPLATLHLGGREGEPDEHVGLLQGQCELSPRHST